MNRDKMVNINDIFNMSQEPAEMVISHACNSTEGMIATGVIVSIWLIIFVGVGATDERRLAIGAASFIAFLFSVAFLILGCGTEYMLVITLIMTVVGVIVGFLARND